MDSAVTDFRLPSTMRAVRLAEFGPPDVLAVEEIPTREPASGEVLVRVAYCGICRHDILSRQGAFPNVIPPVTPGHQISGQVVMVGEGVDHSWLGRSVTTMLTIGCGWCAKCVEGNPAKCLEMRAEFLGDDRDGGCADYIALSQEALVELPEGMRLVDAAVANCTVGTAYHAAVTRGRFEPGETVVVTGATGGVGIHAIKLMSHLGIRCLAVTSSEGKSDLLKSAGADEVIVAPDLSFAARVRELCGGARADAVLDIVGARTLPESMRAVRDGGRVVVLGNVDGAESTIKPALLILREISIIGTGSATKDELAEVLRLVSSGAVPIEIDRVFALEEAAEVHKLMEAGDLRGRAVLKIGGEAT